MSVDFEPVRVEGRRRRNDALVVTVVVIAALVVAVLKPWDQGPAAAPPVAVAPASGTPSAESVQPAATRSPTPTPTPDEPGFWQILEPVVGGYDDWGVMGVVADVAASPPNGVPAGLAGHWAAGAPTTDGDVEVTLAPGALPVYLLGLTFPDDDPLTDVRFWLVRSEGDLEWIDALRAPPGPAGVPQLFIRLPRTDAPEPWAAGEYRVDVLHRERIDRLTLWLADAQGMVPPPTARPVSEAGLVGIADSDPSGVRRGLFATVDGRGVPFDVADSRPLDETDAWLVADSPLGGGVAPTVASAFLPRATGLGVMLTSNARVDLAILRRLAPSPLAPAPPMRGGISSARGRTPYVVFAAPDGEPLAPGVYALSVSWSDGARAHAETWHVELRPGPPVDLGP